MLLTGFIITERSCKLAKRLTKGSTKRIAKGNKSCKVCGGSGTIKCRYCKMYRDNLRACVCGGSGAETCWSCGGTGGK